nr:unnamed protein product [Spirometra erinaceieuropaei]
MEAWAQRLLRAEPISVDSLKPDGVVDRVLQHQVSVRSSAVDLGCSADWTVKCDLHQATTRDHAACDRVYRTGNQSSKEKASPTRR